ncbi:Flagellar M-ring protein OS=Castellaniella defragrans OX=75697 GN=HNR28_000400 PE=3 SV=1 [Castellaniella defragrans]
MSSLTDWTNRYPALARLSVLPRPVLLGLGAAAVAVLVVFALWMREPDYRTLFSNVEGRDGGAIVNILSQRNVPYKFADNGSTILVPADQVYTLRLELAEQGLPRGGNVGFELLDQPKFGASQFSEQITYQRALEGELARSIEALQPVKSARVHLAIPRQSLFVREREAPTASVLLTLFPARSLSASQVSAIAWLVPRACRS